MAMKKHTRKYLKHFDLGEHQDVFIGCEICGRPSADIHHLDARGMGGDKTGEKDRIENLMALCREHHIKCGTDKEFNEQAKIIHLQKLNG